MRRYRCRRRIDYAIYTGVQNRGGGLDEPRRGQTKGVADHKMVMYEFRIGAREKIYQRPKYAKLGDKDKLITDEEFEDKIKNYGSIGIN